MSVTYLKEIKYGKTEVITDLGLSEEDRRKRKILGIKCTQTMGIDEALNLMDADTKHNIIIETREILFETKLDNFGILIGAMQELSIEILSNINIYSTIGVSDKRVDELTEKEDIHGLLEVCKARGSYLSRYMEGIVEKRLGSIHKVRGAACNGSICIYETDDTFEIERVGTSLSVEESIKKERRVSIIECEVANKVSLKSLECKRMLIDELKKYGAFVCHVNKGVSIKVVCDTAVKSKVKVAKVLKEYLKENGIVKISIDGRVFAAG